MRLWIVAALLLVTTAPAFGQATSTFNGRVLDQGDAVLPGVTVTATNVSTGVTRETVTNAEGSYYMPGLEPAFITLRRILRGSRLPRDRT
jgi:hypothetical protein